MSKLVKKTITVTAQEYVVIIDALNALEKQIIKKQSKHLSKHKQRKLDKKLCTVQELFIELLEETA